MSTAGGGLESPDHAAATHSRTVYSRRDELRITVGRASLRMPSSRGRAALVLGRPRGVRRHRDHPGVQAADEPGDELRPGRVKQHGPIARLAAGVAEADGDGAGAGVERPVIPAERVGLAVGEERERLALGGRLGALADHVNPGVKPVYDC